MSRIVLFALIAPLLLASASKGFSQDSSRSSFYIYDGGFLVRSTATSVELIRIFPDGRREAVTQQFPPNGQAIWALRCAETADTCLLGFRTAQERTRWLVAKVNKESYWEDRLDNAIVHDVKMDGRSALFTIRSVSGGNSGLYQLDLMSRSVEPQQLSSVAFVNQPGISRYLVDGRIAVLEAGTPSHLAVYAPDRQKISETVAVSRFFNVLGAIIVAPVALEAANETLPTGQLVTLTAPEQRDRPWRRSMIGGAAVRVNGDLAFEQDAQSAISAGGGGMVVLGAGAGQLLEVCSEGDDVRSREVSTRPDVAAIEIHGDGATTLVNEIDLWGRRWQYLLRLPDGHHTGIRACNASEVDRELLVGPGEGLPNLVVADYEAPFADRMIQYSVIGVEGASGRVMVRPYGAFGMPVRKYAVSPIEREWLKAGGRLLIPTLTGDGPRRTPNSGTGDYKANAVSELIAIVDNAARRGVGHSGDYTLIGYSAGGFVAAKAALTHPDRFRSVALISAGLDLASFEGTPLNVEEFGPVEGGFETWFSGVPAHANAPRFLIYQAEDDVRVPMEGGIAFARYLSSLGYRGQLTTGDRGGHLVGLREDTAPTVLSFVGAPL